MDHRYQGKKSKKFIFSARHFLAETGARLQRPQKAALISMDNRLTKYLKGQAFIKENEGIVLLQGSAGIGAAALAFQIEVLAAQGLQTLVIVGTTGAMDRSIEVGTAVAVQKALIDEGTSVHYGCEPGTWVEADAELLKQYESQFIKVSSWTTDAPFRESPEEIAHYIQCGIQCVEMETSALYSVARELGLKALAVLVVSDHVDPTSEEKWSPELRSSRLQVGMETAALTVFEILSKKEQQKY